MANPSRDKGTRAETAVVNWCKGRDLDARRRERHGSLDQGDVVIAGHRLVIEVKWTAKTPTAAMVDTWLAEATEEAENVTVDRWSRERIKYLPVLVHNRQRTTDVGKWIWYLWSNFESAFIRIDGYDFLERLEELRFDVNFGLTHG